MCRLLSLRTTSQEVVGTCIDSILHTPQKGVRFEIIIVDNKSNDRTLAVLERFAGQITIIKNEQNIGFAAANNLGFARTHGKYVLILNPDIIFTEETQLHRLVEKCEEDQNIGILSPLLIYSNGQIQESCRRFPNPLVQLVRGLGMERAFKKFDFYKKNMMLDADKNADLGVDWVIGAFMVIRKDIFNTIGGFDEGFFMYYEDADLCLRLLISGKRTVYVPTVKAIHFYNRESSKSLISLLKVIHFRSILRFYSKHWRYLIFAEGKGH